MELGKRGTRPYFAVDDTEVGAARVQELGGEANEPMPVPGMGWFSTCKDPHRNEFGLWQTDTSAQLRRSRPVQQKAAPLVVITALRSVTSIRSDLASGAA
jgi:hypothetical protein